MAVAKIKKINILAHKSHKKEILELLYDRGFVEILPVKDASVSSSKEYIQEKKDIENTNTEYQLAKVSYALDFLSPYYEDKRTIAQKINNEKRNLSLEEILKIKNSFDYFATCEKLEDYGQGFNTLKSQIIKLKEEKRSLEPWSELPFVNSDLETKNVKVLLGEILNEKYDDFVKGIEDNFSKIEIVKVKETESVTYLYIIFWKKNEEKILKLLNESSLKLVESPLTDIFAVERMKNIDQELEKIEKEIDENKNKVQAISDEHFEDLRVVFDFLTWQLHQEKIQDNFYFTDETFSVMGWVKEKELSELNTGLEKITNSFEIVEMKIEEEEPVPIIMENSKMITPFEFVTSIYGFPRYKEVDPTPFLAGFFIVFFGLCLTDAGYGLILTICAFIFLKFFKITGDAKKLLQVLFFGGILTFIAGGLTGGWFGLVLTDLPEWMSKPLMAIRQVDPVKDPLIILGLSIILGYIHLMFGNMISLWWKIKEGDAKGGILGPGVWIYFLLTVGFWIASMQGVISTGLSKLGSYLFISSIILIIFTQGKSDKPVMKVFGGLAELYFGLSGYVSDILSYSRLLALGLATGIIGMVINIVGMMIYEKIPYIGWLLMILFLIGGHAMNLVISLVGAFVHSGRLQYVEFFKSFFEGGGRLFKPFARENKYINLNNNN